MKYLAMWFGDGQSTIFFDGRTTEAGRPIGPHHAYFDSASSSACTLTRPLVTVIVFSHGL
jgi:hypothetical protein